MASASQTLTTNIVINAKTGNGFSEIGTTLTELGSLVIGISNKLIDIGKESVNVYKDYEKSMTEAEVALATQYGQNTAKLNSVMEGLDEAATGWAKSSIYHTNDVANSISEAAHAGWTYEQILEGIPAAMEVAQAGGMDLSEAVDYITKATHAAGIEFDGISTFTDMWAMAANSSATDIEEMGNAMLQMGSTMRFATDPAELLTLIAVTANAGTTGAEAGTMIRNSIMRLIGPTDAAMEAMERLGATQEEIDELMANGAMDTEAFAESQALLAQHGFSAFKDTGELKSILDIYSELGIALQDIAGAGNSIEKSESALGILKDMFGVRSTTEALNLINAAKDGYGGLYEMLATGGADGYGRYAANLMNNTLYGQIEIFGSKMEELKRRVGETLAPQLEGIMEYIGGIVDSISGLDEGKFNALVAGGEFIAAYGPALLLAGGALRFIGNIISNPVAGFMALAIAVGAGVVALEAWERANYEDAFGLNSVDMEQINSFTSAISDGFHTALGDVLELREGVVQSVETFKTTSQTLTSDLFTKMVTGVTMSQSDIDALTETFETGLTAAIQGANINSAEQIAFWETIMDPGEELDNIVTSIKEGNEQRVADIESAGQAMRDALTAAWADGTISPEEYENIQEVYKSYARAVADGNLLAQEEGIRNKLNENLIRSTMISADSFEEAAEKIYADRDQLLGEYENLFISNLAALMTQEGVSDPYSDVFADEWASYHATEAEYRKLYDEALLNMFNGVGKENMEFGSSFLHYMDIPSDIGVTDGTSTSIDDIIDELYSGDYYTKNLGTFYKNAVDAFGGMEKMYESIQFYKENGQADFASDLMGFYTGAAFASGGENGSLFNVADYYGIPFHHDYTNSEIDVYNDDGAIQSVPVDADTTQFESDINNVISNTENQKADMSVGADVSSAQATISSLRSSELLSPLNLPVLISTGSSIGGGGASEGGGDGSTLIKHATGGRSEVPAIFGEAGPEWAIPERHDMRTAELLNKARAASGFSWTELLSMTGGFNSGYNTGQTLVYSPTINAGDASGVESVLRDDKSRLDKWFREMKMREQAEVYA